MTCLRLFVNIKDNIFEEAFLNFVEIWAYDSPGRHLKKPVRDVIVQVWNAYMNLNTLYLEQLSDQCVQAEGYSDFKLLWAPHLHPYDILGELYWKQISTPVSASSPFEHVKLFFQRYYENTLFANRTQKYWEKNIKERLQYIIEQFTNHQPEKLFSCINTYLLPHSNVQSKNKFVVFADQNIRETMSCMHSVSIRQRYENRQISASAGAFGQSTLVNFKIKNVSVQVRLKQALIEDFSTIEPLADLLGEGFAGLQILNKIRRMNEYISIHLVQTLHFVLCCSNKKEYAHVSNLGIFTEHVHNVGTLKVFIERNKITSVGRRIIGSLLEQLLLVTFILNCQYGVFHNDLHFANVLVIKDKNKEKINLEYVYDFHGTKKKCTILSSNHQGYYIVIIDYGRISHYPQPLQENVHEMESARIYARNVLRGFPDMTLKFKERSDIHFILCDAPPSHYTSKRFKTMHDIYISRKEQEDSQLVQIRKQHPQDPYLHFCLQSLPGLIEMMETIFFLNNVDPGGNQ